MTTPGYLSHSAGDLVAELAAEAPQTGANTGLWPGLTIYRFTAPAGPTWEEIQSLSLCIVAQGRKAVTVDGQTGEDPGFGEDLVHPDTPDPPASPNQPRKWGRSCVRGDEHATP